MQFSFTGRFNDERYTHYLVEFETVKM